MRPLNALKRYGIKKSVSYLLQSMKYSMLDVKLDHESQKIVQEFKDTSVRALEIESAIDYAFKWNYRGYSITPLQEKEEFLEFSRYIRNNINELKMVAEVGTANGGTAFLLSRLVSPHSTIITIDLHRYKEWKYEIMSNFAIKSDSKIEFVTGDTRSEDTLKLFEEKLKGRELDLLFIDGDHRYLGVKKDFENLSRYVRRGGIIAFHDIVPGKDNEVPIFWEELRCDYTCVEFKAKASGWGGIGVIKWEPE